MSEYDDENKKSGWRILLYISPLYLLLAYPLYQWHKKINSSDIDLSKDEYGAFASSKGEIKKIFPSDLSAPKLHDSAFSVHYNITEGMPKEKDNLQNKPAENQPSEENRKRPKKTKRASSKNQKADMSSLSIRAREFMSIGTKKGYMTSLVGKMMNNKKVMKALFNNSMVVNGFMSRETTKAALSSPDALIDYIKNTPAAGNFLNNPVVKKALNSPDIMETMASSKLMSAIMDTPAMKGIAEDPSKLEEVIKENPKLAMLLANPNIMNAISENPEASNLFGKIKP